MYLCAGIDEAGYGPLLGPLVISRTVLRLPKEHRTASPPAFWELLGRAVHSEIRGARGRIVVGDSKKLKTPSSGLRHLETGCLAFAGVEGAHITDVGQWLDHLGENAHREPDCPPWYSDRHAPWQPLPGSLTAGEIAIARSMLAGACDQAGVEVTQIRAATVLEPRFNRMVEQTRSKAAVSFTFVAGHLLEIWQTFAEHHPLVVVDRQGGRIHYRPLLAQVFPEADLVVEMESPEQSAYLLRAGSRAMRILFQVQAEEHHLPVALASMTAKYCRELLMTRFNAWFRRQLPHLNLKPSAGYGADGKRFWLEIEPHLAALGLRTDQVRRLA